ncbi:MAG: HAMP domain-containing histidine kinase [Planctomycetes bacterium]|nr:HAMP domain-containing histidine kinase [Planctomycetota bacterium]
MTTARARAWFGFSVTAAVLVAVVCWLTAALLRLDRDEVQARRQAATHERLRLALWRMDSWLSPQLAREAMRPPGEYRAFPSASAAWTRGFAKLAPGDVVVQSPLLTSESALFPLHFEFGPDGLTSPQAPVGNERDTCEAIGIDRARLDRAAQRLQAFAAGVQREVLEQRLGGVEAALPLFGCNAISPTEPAQTQQSVQEYSNRQRSFAQNVIQNPMTAPNRDGGSNPAAGGADDIGPLVPVWLDAPGDGQLVFVRRVREAAVVRLQGLLVDWSQLQAELTSLVADLFPAAGTRLARCEAPTAAEQPSMLASVPARLVAACDDGLVRGLPLPAMLATTWGVTLLGLAVLAITLRAAIGYGERRARFASAVTHELRTPLTTFRMYSEMLADGMVQDPAAQRDYLATLQRESDRLARVVENVLAWSRLEEGRFTARRVALRVGPLLDRIGPTLQRRLSEAGMTLAVHADDATRAAAVTTDEDAVGQILFNLVDNAAKYARAGSDLRVELTAAADAGRVSFAVCDHGPGVPAAHRQRIFAPFDRGAVAASSNEVPGVGLGLALARGLARDLGGDLHLDESAGMGARFVLGLPRA